MVTPQEENLSREALEEFVDAFARFMVSHGLLEELRERGLLGELEKKKEQGSR